jgi:hypothetical protein
MKCQMGQCATLKVLDGVGGEDTGTRIILTTEIGCHFAVEMFEIGGHVCSEPYFNPKVLIWDSP